MFFGEYNHVIDEKNRIRIPAKLKSSIKGNCVLTKGTNSCLFIFPKEYFENEFLSKLSSIPTFDIASQKPVRMFLSSSVELEEDGQGRMLLHQKMKEFANINKEIVFIGVGERMEVWDKETWGKYKDEDHNFDDVLNQLSSFEV